MGMSSVEWSRYLHETVGLREPPEAINAEVVRRMLARYERELPVVDGAWRRCAGFTTTASRSPSRRRRTAS